jgi:hypothetical protein
MHIKSHNKKGIFFFIPAEATGSLKGKKNNFPSWQCLIVVEEKQFLCFFFLLSLSSPQTDLRGGRTWGEKFATLDKQKIVLLH